MDPVSGVAVVIPAFRSVAFIADAIESALAQTLEPDEVIVVDDGSTDGTEEVVESFLDRVVYVRQENRGPAAARNLGIALTEAPLIALLDADDIWEPGKLAAQVEFMAANPGCALVCCDAWVFGRGIEMHRKYRDSHPTGLPDLSFTGLLRDNPISTLSVLLRRNALEKVGTFDEDRRLLAV